MTSNSARILDKLEQMNKNLNTLSQSLNAVTKTVNSSAGQTETTMKEMENALRETGNKTIEEVKKLGEINGLIEMSKLASQLEIVDPLIKKEGDYLQSEYDRVKHKIVILMEQYNQFYTELADSYHRDIRSLGRHIFEILENDFQRNIENRYYIGTYYKIQSASKNINTRRSDFLTTKFRDLSQTVKTFLNKRDDLDQDLAERIVPLPIRSRESVEIPYWIVETSDDSGNKGTMVFFDSKAQTSAEDGSRYCNYSFIPQNHFSDVEGSIKSTVQEKLRSSSWQQMNEPTQRALQSVLDGLVQQKLLASDTVKEMMRSASAIELVFHTRDGGTSSSSRPSSSNHVHETDQAFRKTSFDQEQQKKAINPPTETGSKKPRDDVNIALPVHEEPNSDAVAGETIFITTEDTDPAEVDRSQKEEYQ